VTAADSALLAQLSPWAFAFALVLARISAAIMLLPGIGEVEIPARLRAGFALALTLLLLPCLAPHLPPAPESLWRAFAMLAGEIGVGLWFGFLCRLIVLAAQMAAQILGLMVGLSSVLLPDAQGSGGSAELGQLLRLAAIVVIFGSGLYAMPLAALSGSYRLLPAGHWLPLGDTAETVVRAVAQSFGLALRLSAPFVLAGTVWQIALGLLARLVPRLQVYFLALPGQLLGGLALLAALAAVLISAWQEAARASFEALPGLG